MSDPLLTELVGWLVVWMVVSFWLVISKVNCGFDMAGQPGISYLKHVRSIVNWIGWFVSFLDGCFLLVGYLGDPVNKSTNPGCHAV
jgi:hypothetical protein